MSGKLKITLIKSPIGKPQKQRRVLKGMGLGKLNRSVVRPDTPEVWGMIHSVSHLVKAEEMIDEAK